MASKFMRWGEKCIMALKDGNKFWEEAELFMIPPVLMYDFCNDTFIPLPSSPNL